MALRYLEAILENYGSTPRNPPAGFPLLAAKLRFSIWAELVFHFLRLFVASLVNPPWPRRKCQKELLDRIRHRRVRHQSILRDHSTFRRLLSG